MPLAFTMFTPPAPATPPAAPPSDASPLSGDGASSLDLRFSARGGRKAVGEVLGVAPPPLPDEPLLLLAAALPEALRVAPRPLVAPLRNLECTWACEK